MNLFNQLLHPSNSVALGSDNMVYGISEWLGISSDPQGFFLYLLIMVGVVIIVIILIYNWVEERRFNKHVESNFSTIEQDALLDDDQQDFLDKFASTTGVLNDAPNGESIPEMPFEIAFEDDDRSIDEAYADLVDAMSKRNRAKAEPSGVTVDHQTVEVMSEPEFIVSDMPEEVINDAAPETEAFLVVSDELASDPAIEEAVTTVPFTEPNSEEATLSFDANETKIKEPLESFFDTEPINEPVLSEPVVPEEAEEFEQPETEVEPLREEQPQDAMDDQGIKNIINRAFKEKYNPNYKAEMEALDTQMAAMEAGLGNDQASDLDSDAQQVNMNNESDPATEIALETDLPDELEESLAQEADNTSEDNADTLPDLEQSTYQQLLNESVDTEMDTSANAQDKASEKADSKAKEQAKNAPEPEPDTSTAVVSKTAFSTELPDLINSHVDIVGTIETSESVSAAKLLESFSTLHNQFELPVFALMQCTQSQWLLLNNATEPEIERFLIDDNPLHITASMQMADRNGPVSRNSIQRFQHALNEIATSMGVSVGWVDPSDPVDRASSLDAFCIEVDKTMFFHLANTSAPFTGIKLRGLVEAKKMVLERDGSFKYYSENAQGQKNTSPEFVLFNRENHLFNEEMLRSSVIKAVTMQLDIPLVTSNAQALDRMVLIARDLEANLNAQLVDDKNRAITEVHLSRILEQIKAIHSAMQLRGITPGSAHAQRLFS